MARHELCVAPQGSAIAPLIDWIRSCCEVDAVADNVALKLALAVEEAVTNVITHGFADLPPPHRIAVRLDITVQAVVAEIIDNGMAFDPTAAPAPDLALPLDQRQPGGLGIHLIRHMVDRLEHRRSDGNNLLRLETARR